MDEAAIIVNATACDAGGALTVLSQFLANIPADGHRWVVFVSDKVALAAPGPNVTLVPVHGVKSWLSRFRWDAVGLSRWLKANHIRPLAKLSLQNTSFNVGADVPSYIYYHQPIPLYGYRWNPFDRRQRTMWFYKHVYPLFVRLFLTADTTVFVQLECIKELFVRRFKHTADRVVVCAPTVTVTSVEAVKKHGPVTLLYPAADYYYKNHRVITEALKMTAAPVEVYFTTSGLPEAADPRIRQLGSLSYEEISAFYGRCDALLFPSYIETYGLPLLEAASSGLPVIAADLPYAREVLAGYEGATFVPANSPRAWAEAIDNLHPGHRHPTFIPTTPTWPILFNAILKNLTAEM